MPGYLDTYGVGEERRGRWIKWTVLGVLAVAIVGTCSYLYFRTWTQEQTIKRFFATLDSKDFQGAYKMWCPPEIPASTTRSTCSRRTGVPPRLTLMGARPK